MNEIKQRKAKISKDKKRRKSPAESQSGDRYINCIMKTKTYLILSIALLIGVSARAQDPAAVSVYEDCSKNGKTYDFRPTTGTENGHTWVDLGLPSGISWASCNVGATTPEGYGNYYAWGETTTKEDYSWATYKHANGSNKTLTKYCNNASYGDNGFTDNKTVLDPEDDAAHVNWGKGWRMPTDAEWKELRTQCTWTWTTQNGVNGYLVTSKTNSNSIFLPAAGYHYDANLYRAGGRGDYWSSSLNEGYPNYAWYVLFNSGYVAMDSIYRYYGQSVRPVCLSSISLAQSVTYCTLTLYADGCENANTILCNAGQQINVTAVPENAHRHFVRWADGNTDNPRLITVTQDTTFTAEFAQTFSGQCGENLYWHYQNTELAISGIGAMDNYKDTVPWLLFRDSIKSVVVGHGATNIGQNAFANIPKLAKVVIGSAVENIGANAFANCRRLYDIYCYPTYPPFVEENSFANYNVYLNVPCEQLRDYQLDVVWGNFKFIQCLGAENTTTDEDVTVTPSDNEAVFVWRADESAATYNLEIRKDGEVFCTLVFNAGGQLSSIAFAPSRNGQTHHAAEQTGAGFRFTVTGLSESTRYTFGMTVKDANNATLQTYTGEFKTTGTATALDNAATEPTAQKIVRNGQVLILRGDKTYTTMGVEVNL